MEREARRQIDLLVGQVKKGSSQAQLEFYPYRYFAAEGFLPGYNFPRLPVRTYIPSGEKGEFISRSRIVAIREFALGNIVYYRHLKKLTRLQKSMAETPDISLSVLNRLELIEVPMIR